MAEIRDVTEDFAVAPQIAAAEVPALAGRFTLLINNRPDGEAPDQPTSAELEAAATTAGLRYVHAPSMMPPTPEQTAAMKAALAQADGPTLAFCRTGTRSILLWGLNEAASGRSPEEVEAAAAGAGYQIGPPLRALLPQVSG